MRLVCSLLVALSLTFPGLATPARIILLRHAEKPPDESDVHLSAQGKERARALVPYLTSPELCTNGAPVALFATKPTRRGHGSRPYETLEPLARHLELRIQTPCAAADGATLAKRILEEPTFDGRTVIVCWVHTKLPELAKALGVKPKPPAWKDEVYDRVWVISYGARRPSLTTLPQALLPGDRRR